jgi:hypothetical protein
LLTNLALPTVPGEVGGQLITVPSALKIFNCLKGMGLDRVPRPDELTTRFLLRAWDLVGPKVVKHI